MLSKWNSGSDWKIALGRGIIFYQKIPHIPYPFVVHAKPCWLRCSSGYEFLFIFYGWLLVSLWYLGSSYASHFSCDLFTLLNTAAHTELYQNTSIYYVIYYICRLGRRRNSLPLLFSSEVWWTYNSPAKCFIPFFFISRQDKPVLWGPGWQISSVTRKALRKFTVTIMWQ